MTKFLLAVHVLAAIIAIGPVTVAASMFPAAARRARSQPGDGQGVAVVRTLHRISRVYAVLGVAVPVFGFAVASRLRVLGDAWLIVSIVLTAIAAVILALLVLPRQAAILADLDPADPAEPGDPADLDPGTTTPPAGTGRIAPLARTTARLAMYTGVFNLLWAAVTVLMIVRPGSTTGV